MPHTQHATRSDIAALRVEMLERFATKDDFKRLAVEIVRTQAEMHAMEARLKGFISEGNSRIIKVVEDHQAQVGKIDRRQVIMDYRVDTLEKRVKAVEDRPS